MDYEQTFTHPLERLQIELVSGLRGDELRRWGAESHRTRELALSQGHAASFALDIC